MHRGATIRWSGGPTARFDIDCPPRRVAERPWVIPTAFGGDSLGIPSGGIFWLHRRGRIRAMPSAVRLREDYSAEELRGLARRSKDVNQSRRLLSLAGVRDGMDRGGAAKIGSMDRQTLRDWVHRFNASGPDGLLDNWTEGPKPACHSSRWPRSPESSRLARSARKTASCAGGVSISTSQP
jgi:hypothetical protein